MRRVSTIVHEFSDAGAMSDLINLFAFVDDAVFMTKSGDLGSSSRWTEPTTNAWTRSSATPSLDGSRSRFVSGMSIRVCINTCSNDAPNR